MPNWAPFDGDLLQADLESAFPLEIGRKQAIAAIAFDLGRLQKGRPPPPERIASKREGLQCARTWFASRWHLYTVFTEDDEGRTWVLSHAVESQDPNLEPEEAVWKMAEQRCRRLGLYR